MIKAIKQEKMKEFLDDFYNNPKKWYKKQIEEDFEFDEETQMSIIQEKFRTKDNSYSIKYIKNPTERVCLEAVKQNGWAIKYIKKPTEKICLEAVKWNGRVIKFIKNPTEEMCLEALKYDRSVIEYIKNPTERVCLEAVKRSGMVLRFIKNPTEEMCLEAVKQNGWVIQFIKNPTEKICFEAVKQDGEIIQFIKNPSERVCLEALKQDIWAIELIKKQDQNFNIVQAFFDYNWKNNQDKQHCYKYLDKKYITKEQGLIMIEDNPENINLLSKKIQQEILDMKPELEKYVDKGLNDDFFE